MHIEIFVQISTPMSKEDRFVSARRTSLVSCEPAGSQLGRAPQRRDMEPLRTKWKAGGLSTYGLVESIVGYCMVWRNVIFGLLGFSGKVPKISAPTSN